MSLQPWQLYDFDAVGREFLRIVNLAINLTPAPSNLQVIGWRDPNSTTTPRVEVIFQPGTATEQRHILSSDPRAQFQPIDTWNFNLIIRIVTERMQNSTLHSELTAKSRRSMYLPWLAQAWTQEVFTIVDLREQPQTPEVDNEENEDTTNLTFDGLFCIRAQSWSSVA